MKKQEILDKQRKYLWPNHLLYYKEPVPLDRGEGLYVWDVDGNKYLDFFGGILTTIAGHNHPRVITRVQEQIGKIIHTSTLYPNENHVKLADKIAQIAPGDLQVSYFLNSGSEANETAVLLAQIYTGNREVIALRHGYSGRTQLAMSLTGHSTWRMGPTFSPDVKHAHSAYCYRCPLRLKHPGCDVACAQDLEDVIRTQTSGRIAAILAEPIQGVGGFITPPEGYFRIIEDIVRRYGGIFIADEVQTGFGRTGTHWFGIQHWGVEPDVMTMAKGIANGFPLSNVITRPDIAESMVGTGLTISTFGGNPVSAVASLATIEVLEEEAPPLHVQEVGHYLRTELDRMWEKYPLIGEVRGKGLMQGIEMVANRKTREPASDAANLLLEKAREGGLLLGKGGLYSNVIRIAPPLTAKKEDVDAALEMLDDAMDQVHKAI